MLKHCAPGRARGVPPPNRIRNCRRKGTGASKTISRRGRRRGEIPRKPPLPGDASGRASSSTFPPIPKRAAGRPDHVTPHETGKEQWLQPWDNPVMAGGEDYNASPAGGVAVDGPEIMPVGEGGQPTRKFASFSAFQLFRISKLHLPQPHRIRQIGTGTTFRPLILNAGAAASKCRSLLKISLNPCSVAQARCSASAARSQVDDFIVRNLAVAPASSSEETGSHVQM